MDSNTTIRAKDDYTIRVPLDMLQYTEASGKTWPVSFKWPGDDGTLTEIRIDRVKSVMPLAEQKSGTVGDRYECEIEGKIVYIYYTKLLPRKWFKIISCCEKEYKVYYRLRGEHGG